MGFLGKAELEQLLPAEEAAFPSPVPTQVVWFIPQEQVFQARDKEGRAGLAGDRFAHPSRITSATAPAAAICATAMCEGPPERRRNGRTGEDRRPPL